MYYVILEVTSNSYIPINHIVGIFTNFDTAVNVRDEHEELNKTEGVYPETYTVLMSVKDLNHSCME